MLGRFRELVIDILLPPRCANCQTLVRDAHTLCVECWSALKMISAPRCDRCGRPLSGITFDDACTCTVRDWPFVHGRSTTVYNDAIRNLLLPFKHGGRVDLAPLLAGLIAQSGADIFSTIDILVPVPLHPLRLLKRRYNQAALLAKHLGRRTGHPVWPTALRRVRATPMQDGSTQRRRANVLGAFQARPRVAGQRVLLVDDVLTTGATLAACARALYGEGAAAVSFVTVARAMRGE
ncbi:MAG: ComF family protein [Holosporales bacterium]|jgi:ComF family protein